MFDKDKARKEFYKNNPQWHETKNPFEISSEDIEKIVALWPDTKAVVIAKIVGISYSSLQCVTTRMRKNGIVLKKNENTKLKKIDDAITGYKHDKPNTTRE